MAETKTFEQFNMNDDFVIFIERMGTWFKKNKINTDEDKAVELLSVLSREVYTLVRNAFNPKRPDELTFDDLSSYLRKQFVQITIPFKERRNFYECCQMEGEPVLEYYNKLMALAGSCEFDANTLKHVLRDKFICGLTRGTIFERLCELELTATIEDCLKKAQAKEMSMPEASVHKIHRQRDGKSKMQLCSACGKPNHKFMVCKYREYKCNTCGREGHLAKVCKQDSKSGETGCFKGRKRQRRRKHVAQNQHQIQKSNAETDIEHVGDDDLRLFSMNMERSREAEQIQKDKTSCSNYQEGNLFLQNCNSSFDFRLFKVTLEVNGIAIDVEVDTGSAISALPFATYHQKFGNIKMQKYVPILRAYNGSVIKVVGSIDVMVKYKGMSLNSVFVIIDDGCRPLIGRDIIRKLGLVNDMNAVNLVSVKDEVRSEFVKFFSDELGEYNSSKVSLKFKPNLKPVFVKPRSVPFAYKEKLEAELNRLEKCGVISKVETCEYGSPLVCVIKSDGNLRICADYSVTINPFVEDFNHPLPKIDELLRALQGGKRFSKIDLSLAYLQLPVDEETGKILAWSTHKGLFVMKRLPFGCKPNTAIFQSIMEKTLIDCEGSCVFVDDVIVTGRDDVEHVKNLKKVLTRLEKVGFTANLQKCKFFEEKVNYLGYIIDGNGLHKDPTKTRAILQMPRPTTEKEIKAFCGMIIYYGRFMSNLSSILKPLYECLGSGKVKWTEKCENAFDSVKKLLVSDVVLAHYDPTNLSQRCDKTEEKPISFASRTLSKAECNYSAIDREALAIHYGVKKFEQFLLGRKFQIRTDHKPLIAIFGKRKGIPAMAASRLQRWSVYLSNFDFEIVHIAGKDNGCADALSRLSCERNIDDTTDEEYSYLNFVENEFQRPIRSLDVAKQTEIDPELKVVLGFVKNGWSESNEFKKFTSFYEKRNELTMEKGVLMWGHRVIIPELFRKTLLNEIHSAHFGVVKLKSIARSYFWWPKIDRDIEELVKGCDVCRSNQINPPRVDPVPWPVPAKPFERIHIDFCGPIKGFMFLVMVDTFSKWVEVAKMSSITSDKTIECLKTIFSRLGVPNVIVSDNGPSFVSFTFGKFCESAGIKHITTPPYHPNSNGPAENAVRNFKSAVCKMLNDKGNSNLDDIIIKYLYMCRNSPQSTTKRTPYELVFNREPNLRWNMLAPSNFNSDLNKFNDINKKNICLGDLVYVKDFYNKKWVKARISNVIGKNYFEVITEDKKHMKRHIDHITPTVDKSKDTILETSLKNKKGDSVNKKTLKEVLLAKTKIPKTTNDHTTMGGENIARVDNSDADGEFQDAVDVDFAIPVEQIPAVESVSLSSQRPKRLRKVPNRLNL